MCAEIALLLMICEFVFVESCGRRYRRWSYSTIYYSHSEWVCPSL